MKRFLRLSLTASGTLTIPQLALGAEHTDTFGFANSISLWIAIVVGVATSVRNARRIGGRVLASMYTYFGISMVLVVLGFFAIVIPVWAPSFLVGRVHDVLFIVGYAIMAIGTKKILTASGLK